MLVLYTLSEAWSGVNWADLMAVQQGALGTDFFDRSILRPKHRAYYRSGRPVIKSHEIRPIHSAPSLGQSILFMLKPFNFELFVWPVRIIYIPWQPNGKRLEFNLEAANVNTNNFIMYGICRDIFLECCCCWGSGRYFALDVCHIVGPLIYSRCDTIRQLPCTITPFY